MSVHILASGVDLCYESVYACLYTYFQDTYWPEDEEKNYCTPADKPAPRKKTEEKNENQEKEEEVGLCI